MVADRDRTHQHWTPPRPLTPAREALVRSLAVRMAHEVLGPSDHRVDALAADLAHRALSYGRTRP